MCVHPGVLITGVDSQLDKRFPPAVWYAFRYWVSHWRSSNTFLVHEQKVNRFFRTHVLHWIEFPACVGSSKTPKESCSVASAGPTASDLLVFAPRAEFGNRYPSLTSAAKALDVPPSTVKRRAAGRKPADEAATSRLTLDIG